MLAIFLLVQIIASFAIPLPPYDTSLLNNRYEVKDVLGKGTFGVVYRAKDLFTKRNVAIKRCILDMKVCENEVKIMRHHLNGCRGSVRILDSFYQRLSAIDPESLFLVLELMDCSLYQRGHTVDFRR